MQHPDEGTIHSWLDGALPPAEAASLEAHVATCETCAAAVAEARGFIAASSRILTALDDVPRGVLPAVPERKRDLRVFWRAAAAMLVVAGGSLVVMREGVPDTRIAATTKPAGERLPSPAPVVTPEATGPGSALLSGTAAPQALPAPTRERINTPPVADERDLSRAAARRGASEPAVGTAAGIGAAADAATPPVAASQSAANFDALETKVPPLKLLSVQRTPGLRRTTYEISPKETVVLTEVESIQLSGVVVTGAQTTDKREIRPRGNTALQSQRAEAAPAAPPPPAMMDSRTGNDSAVSRRETAAAKTPMDGVVTAAASAAPARTISWTEPGTGKTLTLTGNLSVERLQEIRLRIEKERAAAGAKAP